MKVKKQWLIWICLFMSAWALITTFSNPAHAQGEWSYQRIITIDHTQIAGDLEDFPVLIHLSGDWLQYQASGDPGHVRQEDGGDIRFSLTDGVRLDHETELYDGANGTLVAWVRIPSLSSTSDTEIYMLYGNSDCEDQWNPEAVWDEHFVMVHHMEETAGTHFDSTGNQYAGEATAGVEQDAVGAMEGSLDGGDEFLGGNDWVRVVPPAGWSDQDQGQQRAVIKGGKIYVVGGGDDSLSSMHAYIYVYNLVTGDLLQQSPSIGTNDFTSSETAPVVDEPMVYAASTFGQISAWNMNDEDILQWTTTGLSVWSNRIEYDGSYLYATTTDYRVVKIDASNGSVVANFNLDPDDDDENAVPPYLDDVNEAQDFVYAMGDSYLYKLNASDLSPVSTGSWPVSIGSNCLDYGGGHSRMAPIMVNDSYTGNEPWIITGCWGNSTFYAYDSSGNLEWSRAIDGGVRALASYNPNNGFVYIPSRTSTIYALDVRDGDQQFAISSVPAGSTFDRPCTISGNYLIFKTTGGTTQYFYIYDATAGTYIAHYPIGSNLFLTCFPVAVSRGYLVSGGSLINYGGTSGPDGGIFGVKAGTGEAVDYYPLYGPQKFGYIENALTGLDDSLNPTAELTLEAWANLDVRSPAPDYMNDHLLCRADTYCLKFTQHSMGDVPRFQVHDGSDWQNLDLTSFGPLSTGAWHHLVGTWDGADMYYYIDGEPEGTRPFGGTIRSTGNPTCIGSYNCTASPANQSPEGRLDEVRLSNTARSGPWITTSYNNQSAPGQFYDVGEEELPTAVTLAFFGAYATGGNVVVEWRTVSEVDLLGFYLYRSTAPESGYSQVSDGLIPADAPDMPAGSEYRWVDGDTSAGTTYYYKLEIVDYHGDRTSHGPVSVEVNYALYLPLVKKP
jgi:hypothetical protein